MDNDAFCSTRLRVCPDDQCLSLEFKKKVKNFKTIKLPKSNDGDDTDDVDDDDEKAHTQNG